MIPGRLERAEYRALCEALLELVGFRCERCGRFAGTPTSWIDPHHRRMRSQGGPDTAENLVVLCRACHDWIHAEPEQAAACGLIIRSWEPLPAEPWRPRPSLPKLSTLAPSAPIMQNRQIHPTEGQAMSQHPFDPNWQSSRSALAQAGRDLEAAIARVRAGDFVVLCSDGQRRIPTDFSSQLQAEAYLEQYGCGCGEEQHKIQPLPSDAFAGLPGLESF